MLESGKKRRGRRGTRKWARTHPHAWTHIPIQTQVTLFEAEGSHKEFPLSEWKRGEDKTRGRRGWFRRRQGRWGEGEGTAALAKIVCIVKVLLLCGCRVLKMPWPERSEEEHRRRSSYCAASFSFRRHTSSAPELHPALKMSFYCSFEFCAAARRLQSH